MPSILPTITINGVSSTTISGLIITSLPPIRKPAMRAVAEAIDGRDGDEITKLGYEAYDKPCEIALAGSYDVDAVIKYLNQDGIITFSNEPDKYYRFKQLEGIDFEKLIRFKTAKVIFHCQPFKYSTTDEELTFFEPESVSITNAGNIYSKPEIALTGHGNMEMSINGSPVLAIDFGDEQQTIIIDSEKMNAYGAKSNIKELTTNIEPVQDFHGYDSPWMDSNAVNKTPYIQRAVSGTASRIGNAQIDKIIGGSVAWNQLIANDSSSSTDGTITYTKNSDKSWTITGTFSQRSYKYITLESQPIRSKDIVLVSVGVILPSGITMQFGVDNPQGYDSTIYIPSGMASKVDKISNTGTILTRPFININDMEIGAGINITVKPMLINLTQMLGSTIANYIYNLEQATAGAGVSWFRNLFPDDYYSYDAGTLMSVKTSAHIMRDANNNIIGNYPLDSDLELRGLFKLDSNNNLYCDGDEYSSNGNVMRKYGIVDLGTLAWVKVSGYFYTESVTDYKKPINDGAKGNAICSEKYLIGVWAYDVDKTITLAQSQTKIGLVDSDYNSYTAEQLANALSGNYLIYELASSTTETADAFTNPQNVVSNGSQEYTDARAVKIPVGHETFYANICEIEGWNACDVTRTGKNLAFTSSGNNVVIAKGKAGATYCFSLENSGDVGFTLKKNSQSGAEIIGISSYDSHANYYFTLTEDCDIFINGWSNVAGKSFAELASNFQIELGNQKTDFEEYEGIKRIIDWNINQWDEEYEEGRYNAWGNGEKIDYSNSLRSKNFIPVLPEKKYCFVKPVGRYTRILFYDENYDFIGAPDVIFTNNPYTEFTTIANAHYMTFFCDGYGTEYNGDISINYPSSYHDYFSYIGKGMIYKAQLNITTGLMRVLGAVIDLTDGFEAGSVGASIVWFKELPYQAKVVSNSEPANVISELYNKIRFNAISATAGGIAIRTNNYMYVNTGGKDIAPVGKAIYELENPIEFYLTATEIMELIGENHIFTNTGSIESCVYTKDGADVETSGEIITMLVDVGDIISNRLKNRMCIGNYDNIKLNTGINTISFHPIEEGSEIDEMAISKFSRWL